MFATGTQCKNWVFKSEEELEQLREKVNKLYVENYIEKYHPDPVPDFLTPADEKCLCKYFEMTLNEFCKKFKPPMPKAVTACSLHYFKRFYLHNSVMDFHPKHIIVTCVFLACKVEEFNVSIMQFVSNVRGDRAKAREIILSHELLLMEHLNFDLIVHHPYRAVEGFLIDIKARCCPQIVNPERYRPCIEDFLDRIFFTDAYLIYAPSQIALAAIAYASRKFKENLMDLYIRNTLLKDTPDKFMPTKELIKKIWMMVKSLGAPPRDRIKVIEKKLEMCRNEENNPNSIAYKRKLEELQEDDELEQSRKYMKLAEEQSREDKEILGTTAMD